MSTYHITKTERGWELRKQGATRPSKVAATQEDILRIAADFLQSRSATVAIHRADGSLQEERSYPEPDESNSPGID